MYLSPGYQLRIRIIVSGCAVRAAQELLGAPTIGGGGARPGVVMEGVKEVKLAVKTAWRVQK
jgi:hypothetical protein